jgi:hypothetical protein
MVGQDNSEEESRELVVQRAAKVREDEMRRRAAKGEHRDRERKVWMGAQLAGMSNSSLNLVLFIIFLSPIDIFHTSFRCV